MIRLRLMVLGACVAGCGLALALLDMAAMVAKREPPPPVDDLDLWPGNDDELEGVLSMVNVWAPKTWRARA